MATERFNYYLNESRIDLDQDVSDYICGMLDDMTLTDHEEVREATEPFFMSANINDNARNKFYKALFSDSLFKEDGKKSCSSDTSKPIKLISKQSQQQDTTSIKQPVPDQAVEKVDTATPPKRLTLAEKRAAKLAASASSKQQKEEQEPTLVAISQQSRFHTETFDPNVKEIDLPGVQISINDKDLLIDAHLKLKPLTRYGLVGQNGVGKSILMRCLADNILVGLPQNLNILHISQLEDFDENTTVAAEILSADKNATIAVREYEVLRKVIGDFAPTTQSAKETNQELNKAAFLIMQSRIKDRVEEANRIAIKRSGARGRTARKELVKLEKEYADFSQLDPQTYITADMANTVIAEVFERIELVDEDERRNRAHKILKGLGFNENQSSALISTFSGGWRMRIALAKSLFIKPDILLLDEPTNHLDLPAILWLQEYILNDSSDMIVVVVSHDREFLNNVTEETIILKDKQLKYHPGNYQDWEANTEEQRIRKQGLLDNMEKRKKQIQASIQHNLQQAKSTGDDKRHGMVNSRRKKLERLGMEKTEDGKRFKQSYRAGFHLDARVAIVIEQSVKTASIKIPEPTQLRYNGPVFRVNEASFRYKEAAKNSIEKFSINIEPNARIAFIGPNGCGKSTLLNMITGRTQPTGGDVYRHPLLRIGYFSQHTVDQLDFDITPIEALMLKHPGLTDEECRAHFGSIGISGKLVLQKISSLSGGQRNRIAFAIILYEQPHVLVLDEITNHLDMGTVETLVDALAGYSGALIVVSHDVWFLKQIFEPEYSDDNEDEDPDSDNAPTQSEIYTFKEGSVQKWEKGIDAYVSSVLKSVRKKQ